MTRGVTDESIGAKVVWMLSITVVSAALGMSVLWRAPGLDLYARDWLMRARGQVEPPTDIVIVAIDDESIARLGRFPWRRQIIAQAVGIAAAAHPKAIALDVLFSDPTGASEDRSLAEAIAHAGNVVSAAQLVDNAGNAVWLRPLPEIEQASAAVGHVNVSTELEGTARQILLQQSDDRGRVYWAMPLETVRVGDGASERSIREVGEKLQVGSHSLSIQPEAEVFASLPGNKGQLRQITAQRMIIDYIGPAGSFSPYTFSIADLLEGRIRPAQLQGKYVLIGATAASLGDRLASPFIHMEGLDNRQHGSLMPGVEVLANALHTILRNRFYSDLPGWLSAACAGLIALLVSAGLSLGHKRHETVKQIGILVALAGLLLVCSYLLFTRYLIVPPLVPTLVSLSVATPLTLIRRSMVASFGLDERLQELARAEAWLWPSAAGRPSNSAELIARITGAHAVAILEHMPATKARYTLASSYGAPVLATAPTRDIGFLGIGEAGADDAAVPADLYFELAEQKGGAPDHVARRFHLTGGTEGSSLGILAIAYRSELTPNSETIRLSVELATASLSGFRAGAGSGGADKVGRRWLRLLPRRGEWKAEAVAALQRKVLARARFVDRAVQSVHDGLIVSGPDGRIVFANRRAADIVGVPERSLMGSDLFARLGETAAAEREILSKLIIDRTQVEREIAIGNGPRLYYILRLSPVQGGDGEGRAALGWVASLSDITKERQLQQMKTDVMALVTHELRTPLTAIQGISEVLSQFDVDPGRRRQMHTAINEEAKRLSRMIDDYLDLTRLEAGVRPMHLAPVRLESLVERTLLLMDPVAAQRGIVIVRQFPPGVTPVLADPDLLSRAVTNLVANAIKYSRPEMEVTVVVREIQDTEEVEVSDHGPGIAPEHMGRIFEKFYRVPHVEDPETPGTGLGLTIVREIMELHGGTVSVESVLAVGSTFRLSLPKGRKEAHQRGA
jgi:PAS domain S-box-containing protein